LYTIYKIVHAGRVQVVLSLSRVVSSFFGESVFLLLPNYVLFVLAQDGLPYIFSVIVCCCFFKLKKENLKVQKIDFIAPGLPIMLSLSQQSGMPPAKSGAQST
jgi:hypothetical protein